jgi:signal transduction histidine kinase
MPAMQRAIEAGAAGRRSRLVVGAGAALVALALLLAWWLHPDDVPASHPTAAGAAADTAPAFGWAAVIALVLMGGAGGLAGHALARLAQRDALREARVQAQVLAQLLDVWQWHTDAEHRLVRLAPPHGAPASAWVDGVPAHAPLLWERFTPDEAQEAALPERMAGQIPLEDVAVRRAGQTWVLRGVPRFDADGRFAGYIGTAWPVQEAAPAGPPAEAPADAAEQAAFGYTVSHDLRAPLRVVEGFARILIEDYGRVLDRVGRDHLERVLGAAARMNQMIDALLALSQLSSQPLTRQPVNLTQLAGYVVDDLRRQQPERHVEVRIAPGLMAQGDPTLLRLVLENLLGNAWKYTAKSEPAHIAFECVAQDGERVYLVRDNGAGFDMRFADRLFGVFQRLHAASDFPGTGVGLASVRRIVRRHGGEVWAEGEVGAGATFYFTLGA